MKNSMICLCLMGTALIQGYTQESGTTEIYLEPMDVNRTRTVPLKVYLPKDTSPAPVVIFSHGLGGSREGNPYLGTYWAEAGYVAVFTQHPGSDDSVWKEVPPQERMEALKAATKLKTTIDRFKDIPFVIDQLEKWNASEDGGLSNRLDLERIGLSGHSYGAVTTQALMGQKFPIRSASFSDNRIDAFILMSPSHRGKMTVEETFGEIASPVLSMTGTNDTSVITPDVTAEARIRVYQGLPEGDKFHLVFHEGEHNAFSDSARYNPDRVPHHHPAIQKISTKFWDAYLKQDESAKAWLKSEMPITESNLVEEDVWEWK